MRDESGTAARRPDRDPGGHTADGSRHASTLLALPQLPPLVDKELGVSEWFSIDPPSINEFADFNSDRQSIHADEELARGRSYGETIAYGFHAPSILFGWASGALSVVKRRQNPINCGLNSVRFITPGRRGERVRGRFTLKQVTTRNTTSIPLTIGAMVEIENHHKPALVAERTMPINT
ncbi:MaoC/PaaZ C-terminal domain-containing protein [Burkholderia lata]|uniref:Nodulation protein NodN n=1 Tax=Burkholderia lata (strain ATCC 17760 / DSM 23089 / LMG 22485 / NCIMB 9086 / R18194 / 383) TaxID=482957 RepID=A0A6P2K4L9_BURL3|nr:MaoC/PaaZ C-terminal domain-containing protein [Burkholderia lata]VWB52042.1 nodulation protein NodN [Burkholderia lata]